MLLDTGSASEDPQQRLSFAVDILQASTEYSLIAQDLNGKILLWNEGARRLYGYQAAEVLGTVSDILFTPEDVEAGLPQSMREIALASGKWEGVLAGVQGDGEHLMAHAVLTPHIEPSGAHAGYLLIARDISREVTVVQAVEGLLEAAPDAMMIADLEGRILLSNYQTEKLFGYSREELTGMPLESLVPAGTGGSYRPPSQSTGQGMSQSVGQGTGESRERFGVRRDGQTFPVEISLSPLESEGQRYLIGAVRDVTERKIFERALNEKNIELANANQAKDRFLATMSHELRTPLNAIIGFTGTLLMKLPGPLLPDQERHLRTVQTSGRHLLSLINDLLDLAKIESGKVEIRREPVDCRSVLEEAVAALRPAADAKGLAFEASIDPPGLTVCADRRSLTQILLNLAGNAIKFTDRGGVTIAAARYQDGARALAAFRVSDTGTGIAAEDQAKLFQPFSRVRAAGAPHREGTGLGLHLSRKLAELLGGEIRLESESGRGSTFTLLLEEA